MPRKLTLQELADDVIREARMPFSAEDFLQRVQERWSQQLATATLNRLRESLLDHRHLIGMESEDFLPCRAVLEKIGHVPLTVPISNMEQRAQIFIPGYRLIPFVSAEIGVERLTLLGPRGVEIPKYKKTFLLEEVFEFYQYSNEQHFPDHIKINEYVPGKSSLTVTVWNMEGIFPAFNSRAGDQLLLNLMDYEQGLFRVSRWPAKERQMCQLKSRSLFVSLEAELVRLSERPDFPAAGLEKQLLRAFYNLRGEVLSIPAFSLKHFIEFLEKITVTGCEWGYPRFVPAGNLKHAEAPLELMPPKPTGRRNTLEDILDDVGLPFCVSEFKAILRTVITRKTYSLQELVDLLFSGKGKLFADEKQEEAFYKLLRKTMVPLYEQAALPESRIIADLREKTVQVKLNLVKILKILEVNDIELADLPAELLDQVIDLDSFCVETLTFLEENNRPPDLKVIRDIQLAHKIIGPKIVCLEEEILHGFGIYS